MIEKYIDFNAKRVQKEEIARDGNFDILNEVMLEEAEIAELAQQIVYWAHQTGFKEMICHQIVILAKKILNLLQIEDEQIHQIVGKHKYHDFEKVHVNVDKFEHIARLVQAYEPKVKEIIMKILSLVEDYKEGKIGITAFKGGINNTCSSLMKLVGLDKTHLEAAYSLIDEHKEMERKARQKKFRNIRK